MHDIADDLWKQLKKGCGRFVCYSLALERSADTKDTAQLLAITHGVNENFEVIRDWKSSARCMDGMLEKRQAIQSKT